MKLQNTQTKIKTQKTHTKYTSSYYLHKYSTLQEKSFIIREITKYNEGGKYAFHVNSWENKITYLEMQKCVVCNRNIHLVLFECKCELPLCKHHIFFDKHECKFDYKKQYKESLANKIVKVEPDKRIQ